MATTVKERCDKIVGQGNDFFITIGGYKKAEGDTDNHYLFGVNLDIPSKFKGISDPDIQKAVNTGHARIVSVSQAPFKAKLLAGEMTEADIVDWQEKMTGDNFLVAMNEVRERTAGAPRVVDTVETLAARDLAARLKKWDTETPDKITSAAVPLPPKVFTKDGKVNYLAWAKDTGKAQHPWYVKVYKTVKAQQENDKGFE